MNAEQADIWSDAVATISHHIDMPAVYTAIAVAIVALAAAAVITAGYWTGRCTVWAIRRPGLRRLEQYANNPIARDLFDDLHRPRKENPQP